MITRVGWITRHQITDAQSRDLEVYLKTNKIIPEENTILLEKRKVTWVCSLDKTYDDVRNAEIWKKLQNEFNVLIGVFPLVARIAKPPTLRIFSSIAGGTKQNIQHLRWEEEK